MLREIQRVKPPLLGGDGEGAGSHGPVGQERGDTDVHAPYLAGAEDRVTGDAVGGPDHDEGLSLAGNDSSPTSSMASSSGSRSRVTSPRSGPRAGPFGVAGGASPGVGHGFDLTVPARGGPAELPPAGARHHVVVHQARRLHGGVAGRRADEAESEAAQLLAHGRRRVRWWPAARPRRAQALCTRDAVDEGPQDLGEGFAGLVQRLDHARVGDGGLDLRPVAHDPGIVEQPFDVSSSNWATVPGSKPAKARR